MTSKSRAALRSADIFRLPQLDSVRNCEIHMKEKVPQRHCSFGSLFVYNILANSFKCSKISDETQWKNVNHDFQNWTILNVNEIFQKQYSLIQIIWAYDRAILQASCCIILVINNQWPLQPVVYSKQSLLNSLLTVILILLMYQL